MTVITHYHLFVLILWLIQTETVHIKSLCIAFNVFSPLLHLRSVHAVHRVQEVLVKPIDLLVNRGHSLRDEWYGLWLLHPFCPLPSVVDVLRWRVSHKQSITIVQQLFFLLLSLQVQGVLILTVKQLDVIH